MSTDSAQRADHQTPYHQCIVLRIAAAEDGGEEKARSASVAGLRQLNLMYVFERERACTRTVD